MKTKLTDKTFNPNLNEKLRYLKLNNFKGFSKNTEIYFYPTINLLYGKNSSGKSTIIQSLRLLKKNKCNGGSKYGPSELQQKKRDFCLGYRHIDSSSSNNIRTIA